MKAFTIQTVKEIVRNNGGFMLDEINDPLDVKLFVYRLEKREIINRDCADHHYAVYSTIRKEQKILN